MVPPRPCSCSGRAFVPALFFLFVAAAYFPPGANRQADHFLQFKLPILLLITRGTPAIIPPILTASDHSSRRLPPSSCGSPSAAAANRSPESLRHALHSLLLSPRSPAPALYSVRKFCIPASRTHRYPSAHTRCIASPGRNTPVPKVSELFPPA